MRQNNTLSLCATRATRPLCVGAMLCLLAGCSVGPKIDPVREHVSAIQGDKCNEVAENCTSTEGERYHYYLGLLSVYLISL